MSSAKAPAAEKVPEQPRKDSDDGGPAERRTTMRPELGGLTETLTLKIFQQLDFPSLAAVKVVDRRFRRIAKDPALLRRVSVVQWAAPKEASSTGLLRTDCAELGSVALPAEPEEAAAKFLAILDGLLEGGAALVSLETPSEEGEDGGVLPGVQALLTKRSKRLRALGCCAESTGFLGLVESQPELAHLRIGRLPQAHVEELVKRAPNLRHLDLLQRIEVFGIADMANGLVEALLALVPQLRSLFIKYLDYPLDVLLEALHEAGGDKLLFRAIGAVAIKSILQEVTERECVRGMCELGLAVGDFGREERGRLFLCEGKPGDAWDEARHTIPQPTTDIPFISNFVLDKVAEDIFKNFDINFTGLDFTNMPDLADMM